MNPKHESMLTEALNSLEDEIKLPPWKRQPCLLGEMQKRSGVAPKTVGRWLSGNTQPSLDKFEQALNACGYDLVIVKRK